MDDGHGGSFNPILSFAIVFGVAFGSMIGAWQYTELLRRRDNRDERLSL